MRRTALSVLMVLLPAAPGMAQQDAAWQIHIDRPAAVGDRCSVVSSGSQVRRTKSSLSGQPPEDALDKLEISYAATHEVLAVGKNGNPTRMRLTIERLRTDDGSGPQEQFTPGTVVETRIEGDETQYFLERDELEGTIPDALNLAGANLGSIHEPSEDNVFQSRQLVRPGSRLPADSRLLARAITLTTPFQVDAGQTSGEMVLEKVSVENQIPALVTQSKFDIAIKGFKASSGQFLKDSYIRSSTKRVLPIDPSLPLIHESIETDMRLSSREEKKGAGAGKRATSGKEGGGPDSGGARQEDGDEESPGFTTTFHRNAVRDVQPLPAASPPAGDSAAAKP